MPKLFGLNVGDTVGISSTPAGYLSADKWINSTGGVPYKGTVVGFDTTGYPLLYVPGLRESSGVWATESDAKKKLLGVDSSWLSKIPNNVPCLFQIFSEGAIKPLTSKDNPLPADVKMNHNLKVGDRIVVGMSASNTQPQQHTWSNSSAPLTATVVGVHSSGNPILFFDTNPGYTFMYSWEYNYGPDVSMIDPSKRTTFDRLAKQSWVMTNTTAFVSEADHKAGKRPVAAAMSLDVMCTNHGLMTAAQPALLDAKEFMKHIINGLPDDAESFLYGEQFSSLALKTIPFKHEVFVKDKKAAVNIASTLRSTFGEGSFVYNGPVESTNPDLIIDEYQVKYRHNDSVFRNFKLHIASAKDATVKSPFEKGGIDSLAFQCFRKDQLVRNFVNRDLNEAILKAMQKKFSAFGELNKAAIEELIRKGFSQEKFVKEIKKTMSTDKAPSFAQMMKDDFHKATYRVAADQMTHGIKEGIVSLLGSKGGTESQLEGMKMLLDSEIGEAAIAMLAGLGLTYAPVVSLDPRAQKLAGEFRVNGMAKAGNVLVETMIGSFLPIVQSALAKLPAEEQVRVAETAPPARIAAPNAAEEQAAEDEANVPPVSKKAVA